MSEMEELAMVVRSRMVENGVTTNAAEVNRLIAAAREEGRREGEAELHQLRQQVDEAIWGVLDQRSAERAAHAAQLVALREEAAGKLNASARLYLSSGHPFLAGALIDLKNAVAAIPLPDADAALARVREEAVRWVVKNPPLYWRDFEQQSEDAYVARALTALGAKP